MITYQELLQTPEYWTTRIQLDLYRVIADYMDVKHLNRVNLATKLGVTKGYISQVLNGDFDHRLSKFVELSLAVDMIPQISFIPVDKVFAKESLAEISIGMSNDSIKILPSGMKDFRDVASSSTFSFVGGAEYSNMSDSQDAA